MANSRVTARHLAEMKGAYEPQRTFDWVINFPIPKAGEITLAVESAWMPTEMNEPIELHYGNEVQYVAGKARWEFGQLVIRDMVDKDIAQALADWRKTVYNPQTGQIFFAANYKVMGDLILLDPTGAGDRVWKVEGLWPSQVSFGSIDYTQNDIVRLQVTIAFDRAYRAGGRGGSAGGSSGGFSI